MTKTRGKRGSKVIIVAAICLAAALLLAGGAIAATLLLFADGGPREPLATVAEGPLPDKVQQLSYAEGMNRWPGKKTDPVIDDSFLAAVFCEGTDVARTLMGAKGDDLDALQTNGVLDLLADDELGASLRCGKKLRQQLAARAWVVVEFTEDDEARQVSVLEATFDELPKLDRHNIRGLQGSCTKEEGETDCKEEATAGVRAGKLWVAGEYDAVDAFAEQWTSESSTVTTNVDIARTLASHVAGAHESTINVKPEAVAFLQGCLRAAPDGEALSFVEHCWPDDVEDTMKSIVAETRGHAYELDYPVGAGRVRVVHTLLARDEDGAEDIERDLGDIVRDWRAHLENHEPELVEKVRAIDDEDLRDAKDAELQAFLRAASKMRVQRDGRVVRLTMEAELTESERRSMSTWVSQRQQNLDIAARVVHALEKGDRPAKKDLAHFVGPEAAEWMRIPRASETECEKLRERYDELVDDGVPTELYGAKFRVGKELEAERCVGSPMPDDRKECLRQAKDVGAMDACPQPRSPFEVRALEQIQGKWKVADLLVSHRLGWKEQRALRNAKLQVAGDRIAWGDARVFVGSLNLGASDSESYHVDLPAEDDPLRMEVTTHPADAERLRLEASDGFGLIITPTSFDHSLFDRPKVGE